MKRIIIFTIIIALSIVTLSAVPSDKPLPQTVALRTYFTNSKLCYSGLSKNNVTATEPIPEADKISSATPIICKFKPSTNTYESDVVFAYCQAFSNNSISVELTAPTVMKNVKTPADTIPFRFIDEKGETDNAWENVEGGLKLTSKPDSDTSQPRVVLSHPIRISVNSNDVDYNTEYTVVITMKVFENK